MSETDSKIRLAGRRSRIQLIKRVIIVSVCAAILIPSILCIVLLLKLRNTEKHLDRLIAEVEAAEADGAAAPVSVFDTAPLEESLRDKYPETAAGNQQENENEDTVKVYLTFDDGPSSNTDAILDILREYQVKATFFVVGKTDEASKQAYRRIVAEGHTLGMHSYSHRYQEIYQSQESYQSDLSRLQEYLYEETGVWCRYCRFPGGSSNTVSTVDMHSLVDYLNHQNITYFDWNIAAGDAASGATPAGQIVANCLNGIQGKRVGIVLLHDAADKGSTVEALPQIIEGIQAMDHVSLLPITDDTVPIRHLEADGNINPEEIGIMDEEQVTSPESNPNDE